MVNKKNKSKALKSSDDDFLDAIIESNAENLHKLEKTRNSLDIVRERPADGFQTEPPRVPVHILYEDEIPKGEIHEYKYTNLNRKRTTKEEERYNAKIEGFDQKLKDLRRSAEVHRQVRKYAQQIIRPGKSLIEIAENIENATRALVDADGLKSGIGFPTGLSLNNCAAHFTPNMGDTTIVKENDVLKVDFGVHVNGHIIDSAFTMTFNDKYNNLLQAVKEATNTGVQLAGIDARLDEIGEEIQQVMESFEVTIDGKTFPVKAIRNLSGHNIDRYQIHGGKTVPIVKGGEQIKMEEGELFAIETFGSTGRGYVVNDGICSHYAKKLNAPRAPLRIASAKSLLASINKNFGTLPFCRRYLDRLGEGKYLLGLNNLVQNGIIQDYPPLMDIKDCFTAQFEHTLILGPSNKEILSKGDDY